MIFIALAEDKIRVVVAKSIVAGFKGAEVTFKSYAGLDKYIKR